MLVIIDGTAVNPNKILFVEPDGNGCLVSFKHHQIDFDRTVEEFVNAVNFNQPLLLTESV